MGNNCISQKAFKSQLSQLDESRARFLPPRGGARVWKTLKIEGPLAWYKGSTAHFLRIAPHTIVTLTANEIYLALYQKAVL
ncbi:unnamed protein product [Rhizoctonia solani]|uniref:Uncharacterized protein n=1 Tax=Rhizoctonia solani TaxID=456999 RepID=A0A8H2WQ03_9AGAM|nr:unnamed protein product [Rhizoctonia solani]